MDYNVCILALHFDIGIRLYFTTTPDGIVARPSLLALVHVRLPPGYTPTNRISPSTKVHHAYYRKGTALLALNVLSFKNLDATANTMYRACIELVNVIGTGL